MLLLFVAVGRVELDEHGEVCFVHHMGGGLFQSHLLAIIKASSHHVITKYPTNHSSHILAIIKASSHHVINKYPTNNSSHFLLKITDRLIMSSKLCKLAYWRRIGRWKRTIKP